SLRKEWYQPVKKQLVVAEGEKAILDVPMTALYGNVNITTKPEADIYKDDEKLGAGTYTGRLSEGIYTFEARKPKHTSDIQKIQITSGEQKNITLSPRPQMGTVEIQSTPIEATITLDGTNKGTTPATLRNLMVGDYTLTLSLPGYATTTKTITITEGKTEQVNETLVNGRAVTINSEPSGISLLIDGNPVGQTPYSGSLSFGNHALQIRQGEKKAEKTVSISQTGGETFFSLSFGREITETANGAFIEMVAIKGGTFQMGSNYGVAYEKPIHTVTVSDFHIGKTEVTQAQWVAIMGSNPSSFKGDNLPVENVSWNDVQNFIGKLNARTGKNYRLPTEAEWEYAAGGGENNRTKWAGTNNQTNLSLLGNYAWYDANSGSKTNAVGTKQPNELGLYDMSGNVWEWCSDWYGYDYYAKSPQNNPKGASSGSGRVLRGGSWSTYDWGCRVSSRDSGSPAFNISLYGFRLALVP
ncbi:MAG: formylglycine-generating enzyme family protein, partial [Mariniphaga sp.]